MFLHDGKEYYPLEVRQIKTSDDGIVYDRDKRNKSYIYVVFENKSKEKSQ